MKCTNCGNLIDDVVKYCPECGCKIERNCRNCGMELSEKDKFCPACGHKQIVDPKIIEEQHIAGQEKVPDSLTKRIINTVLSFQDIKGLTDDTYRNELVKRVFVYNVAVLIITISALFISYRVSKELSFWASVVVFFAIMIFASIIVWIFKFGKCEENLNKYDTVLKEAGKQSAILVIENSTSDGRTGCLVTGLLILIVLVLMSFC